MGFFLILKQQVSVLIWVEVFSKFDTELIEEDRYRFGHRLLGTDPNTSERIVQLDFDSLDDGEPKDVEVSQPSNRQQSRNRKCCGFITEFECEYGVLIPHEQP